MGVASSTTTSSTTTSRSPQVKSLNELPTFVPIKDLLSKLELAQGLTATYKDTNDIDSLIKYIEQNQAALGTTPIDENIKKHIAEYYTDFNKHIQSNSGYQSSTDKDKFLKEQLKYENFYKFLKGNKTKEFEASKKAVLDSPLLKSNRQESEKVSTIFDNIAIMKAKEQFFKYEYILTQIWVLSYLQNMNSAVTSFTTESIKLIESNEKARNTYAETMIQTILNVLMKAEEGISAEDLKFFRTRLDEFQQKMQQTTAATKTQLEQKQQTLNRTLSSSAPNGTPLAASGGKSYRSKKGGFVRDGSRLPPLSQLSQNGGFVRDGTHLPQSFYDLSKV